MASRAISWWRQSAALKQIALFLLTACFALLVYRLTLIREAEMSDPAELALQAYQLGLTHPPGYPLHTLLGFIFTRFIAEPALATNLLSASCASLATGIAGLIVFEITGSFFVSVATALVLAFSQKMWALAIVTEVYDVNLFFFALSIYGFVRWQKTLLAVFLWLGAIAFGLSLGTYLANLLMLPAFLLFLFHVSKRKWADLITFTVIISIFGLLILGYTLIRARTVVPLGVEAPPNTLPNALWYFTAEQYGSLASSTRQLYLSRPGAHLQIFSASFLYIGVLFGIAGVVALWRKDRPLTVFTLLLFAINWGYFTFYRAPDYDNMVMPSYLVMTIWIGASVLWITKRTLPALLTTLVLAGLAGALLYSQYPQRRARAYSREVTNFGLWSLTSMPQDAVVVTDWPRYTLMLYYQKTRGLRPDLVLIERQSQQRAYEFGIIEDYTDYIVEVIDERPVLIDIDDPALAGRFEVEAVNASWFVVQPLNK